MRNILGGAIRKPDLIQKTLDRFFRQFHPLLRGTEAKVVSNRSWKKIRGLCDHPNAPTQIPRVDPSVVGPFNSHRPTSRFVKTIEQAKEGGLPSAARPDDGQQFAGEYVDRHIIHDAQASDLSAEVFGLKDRNSRGHQIYAFICMIG
jgi:hypothetical protein